MKKVFSRSMKEYLAEFKWIVYALAAMTVIRFLLQPIGVPIEIGGRIFSMTNIVFILIIGYGIYFALKQGKFGDVFVTSLFISVVFTAFMAVALVISFFSGIDTYFTNPMHIGPTPNIPQHLLAHLQAIPFAGLFSGVLGHIVFGVTKLVLYIKHRREPAAA